MWNIVAELSIELLIQKLKTNRCFWNHKYIENVYTNWPIFKDLLSWKKKKHIVLKYFKHNKLKMIKL